MTTTLLADFHMHSLYSMDCGCPLEDTVNAAIQKGLFCICFTDHTDYFSDPTSEYEADYAACLKEITRLRALYGDKIDIRLGAEFGGQPHTLSRFEKLFASHPFDFVILSSHQADDLDYWDHSYQRGKTQLQYNRGYYDSILRIARGFSHYCVLGHLDSIKRYDPAGELDDDYCEDIIREILQTVISTGHGIEVNTSSFKYGLRDFTPSRRILNWYYEMGGRIITLGSDCHTSKYVGDHFDATANMLRSIGFKEFCTFKNMQPEFHPL